MKKMSELTKDQAEMIADGKLNARVFAMLKEIGMRCINDDLRVRIQLLYDFKNDKFIATNRQDKYNHSNEIKHIATFHKESFEEYLMRNNHDVDRNIFMKNKSDVLKNLYPEEKLDEYLRSEVDNMQNYAQKQQDLYFWDNINITITEENL